MLTITIIRVAMVLVVGIIICFVIYNSVKKDEKNAEIYYCQDRYDFYKGSDTAKYWLNRLHKLGAEPDEKEA